MYIERAQKTCPRPAAGRAGFTLVEVTLAVAIAVGILAVALFFYRQAERLRSDLIAESTRVATARLLIDRLAVELSTVAPAVSSRTSLAGGSNFLEIVLADLPKIAAWARTPDSVLRTPTTPFRVVRYSASSPSSSAETAAASGVTRSEEVLLKKKLMPPMRWPIRT